VGLRADLDAMKKKRSPFPAPAGDRNPV